jgi:DNA repair protein RecO (recombination protein O)
LKLLPREDAHAALYDAYSAALKALSEGATEAAELRRFEKALLAELGYGLTLERDAEGGAIEKTARYHYQIERGAVLAEQAGCGDGGPAMSGKTLLDMAANNYADPRTLTECKQLMRNLLTLYLGGQTLQTRRVFVELQDV